MRRLLFLLGLMLAVPSGAHAAACTTGQTTCSTDTTNDISLYAAITDARTQERVTWLWDQQCANIYSEAPSTTGHVQRVAMCQSIAAGKLPPDQLVMFVLNSTVAGEILAGSSGNPAGNMVDVDVNAAIGAALTVSSAGGGTVATTATQATTGVTDLVVASATGIAVNDAISAHGIPGGCTVVAINGTTVYMGGACTVAVAMSSTPIVFTHPTVLSGLPTRNWP